MIFRILRTALAVLFLTVTGGYGTALASDPSDIYQAIIDLHHRQLLEKMGETIPAKERSPNRSPTGRKEKNPIPELTEKKPPSRRLVAIYGDRALIRLGGQDVLVRRGSRVSDSGQSFRVAEIRRREVILIPGERSVRFLKRTGPAGLFRFRGRTIVRGVGDTLGPWQVVELGMEHALLKNGQKTKLLAPGAKPQPRPALILAFSGISSGSLASTDFPRVPFSVRKIHGRHALLSFGSEDVEAGIGSTFGRWKIAGIDPSSGVDVLDRLTGNHIMLGGAGGTVPGGNRGASGQIPSNPGGGPPGFSSPGGYPPPVPEIAPSLPFGPSGASGIGIQRGAVPGGGSTIQGGGASGNTGSFAQPPGGPQLPYNGY